MVFNVFFKFLNQKFGIGLILILVISSHIFIIATNYSLIRYSIFDIEDDAALINNSGFIRGGIQKVAKHESNQQICDDLIADVDSFFHKFLIEKPYNLQTTKMNQIIQEYAFLQKEWNKLKELIYQYRNTPTKINKDRLIDQSDLLWADINYIQNHLVQINDQKIFFLKLTFLIFLIDFILIVFVIYLINKTIRKDLELKSNIDALTGARNRNSYKEAIILALDMVKRYDRKIGFIMLDIYFFKKINDTYGHDQGDMVLKSLVKYINSILRSSDILYRIGGEEFVVIAQEIKGDELITVCEKIRVKIQESDFGLKESITISIGASFIKADDTKDSIYKRADNALYISKNRGRNTTTIL